MAKVISSSGKSRIRGPGWFSRPGSLATTNHANTEALNRELDKRISASRLPTPAAQERLADVITRDVVGTRPLPTTLREAINSCVLTLVRNELTPLYERPGTVSANDPLAAHTARNEARARLEYFEQEEQLLSAWQQALCSALAPLMQVEAPRREGAALTITVPLFTRFSDPVGTIDQIVRRFSEFAPDPDNPACRPGTRVGAALINNLLTQSRLTFIEAQKRPYRLQWPTECNLAVADLPETYLANTPLLELLQTPVEIPISADLRTEHFICTATIGHGKSQLMQSLLLRDLDDPAHPSVVVIDSQGDAINTMARLKRFDGNAEDRLIIIDPTDINPPALNLFYWDRDFAATLSEQHREEYLAGVIELFDFIAGGLLGAELSSRMNVVFRFISQLLVEIPNATIHTLIAMLQDPTPYLQYIERLSPTAQTFIHALFDERSQYRQTRGHLLQRLYHVISNPAFERMFAHPENKFDMRAALNDGKVILINTAKAQLKAEWSAIFGRYCVALIMQAAFARAFIPRQQRRLALIHIDKAHEYLDQNIEALMIQGRKYRVALHLYHQHMKQMQDKGLKHTALAIPALRYTGSLNDADASLLANEMNTSSDFLKGVRKTADGAEWSVYVRNLTPTAARITVPFLQAEREPKMSPTAFEQLLERNRQLVGAPRRFHNPNPDSDTPFNNDGDSY